MTKTTRNLNVMFYHVIYFKYDKEELIVILILCPDKALNLRYAYATNAIS